MEIVRPKSIEPPVERSSKLIVIKTLMLLLCYMEIEFTPPSSQYVSSADYPRALSMQPSMAANGLQVNTPPPAADEGLVSDS
ncbi:hypothetical protein AbraIFM66950_004933, partial [Aspergillus brasiliensis]